MDRMHQLNASLDRSIGLIRRLEAVMLEEMRAIESHAPEALGEIVATKLALVNALEAETTQQKIWVELEGCSFTPDGIEALIAAFDQNATLRERWSELRECIGRCDRLNKSNARLIERDRKRIAMSLRILKGEDGQASTYDPRGRPETGHQKSRNISQA
ncbi:flagella synthesis protein FlgN [Thiocystis violacea]|uniref:flagella synthesis protein FlgN n=1 Tax=Thiocystis violacea TaxID=13725 RepID=UPI00190833F9|nr:flagellar protein FlgN [Thiocystis violacea]MBK1723679.1 hypothetical protein [Thiocystis violacea]